MRLCVEALVTICESIAARGSFAAAARAAGVATSTLFKWIADSRSAAERGDMTAPLYFTWREKSDWAHKQFARAKSEGTLALLYETVEEARHGRRELIFNPSTGYPLQAMVPELMHRSDAWLVEHDYDPAIDKFQWVRDPIDDTILAPVYVYKTVAQPSAVKVKALSGLLPKVFGDKQTIDHNIAGQVVHRVEPAAFRSRVVPAAPQGDVIEGQYTEVAGELPAPPLRPDIEQLRAEAARLMRDGPKHPSPEGIVRQADGRPVSSMKQPDDPPDDVQRERPQRDLRDSTRAYRVERPDPAPQRAPNGFPRGNDPTGRKAMKIA